MISEFRGPPDKLARIREMIRGRAKEWTAGEVGGKRRENDTTGAELTNTQDNREAECLRK